MVDGVIGVIGDHVPRLVVVEQVAEPELALVQLHNLVVLHVVDIQRKHKVATFTIVQLMEDGDHGPLIL